MKITRRLTPEETKDFLRHLKEHHDNLIHLQMGMTFKEFCEGVLGISLSTARVYLKIARFVLPRSDCDEILALPTEQILKMVNAEKQK
jgi:hypothetical protein